MPVTHLRYGPLAAASFVSAALSVGLVQVLSKRVRLKWIIAAAKYLVLSQLTGLLGVYLFRSTNLFKVVVSCTVRFLSSAVCIGRLLCLPFVRVSPSPDLVKISEPCAKHIELSLCQIPDGASFSFCGCSWMLFYHLGVASSLQKHTVVRPGRLVTYCGASCGSLVAAALAIDVSMQAVKDFGMAMHAAADKRFLGPVGDMSRIVRSGLEALYPADAHTKLNHFLAAGNTLAVSVSVWDVRTCKLRNVLDQRRRFESRDELITLLLCSCHIPIYYETFQWYRATPDSEPALVLDGGATNNMPTIDESTITVSPRTREGVISPQVSHYAEKCVFSISHRIFL